MRGRNSMMAAIGLLLMCAMLPSQSVSADATAASETVTCRPPVVLAKTPALTRHLGAGLDARVWRVRQQGTVTGTVRTSLLAVVRAQHGGSLLLPVTSSLPVLTDPATVAKRKSSLAVLNGDYFEPLKQGDAEPRGTIIEEGEVMFSPGGWGPVLAVDDSGMVRATRVLTQAVVKTAWGPVRTDVVNDPALPAGKVVIFTDSWQSRSIPSSAYYVLIRDGQVVARGNPGRHPSVPVGGYIVAARTITDLGPLWLKGPVVVRIGWRAKKHVQIRDAAGTGGVALRDGHVKAPCSAYENLLRPRSMIAWDDSGTVWMMTMSTGLPDPPDGVRMGGGTKYQLARAAASFGATWGVTLDGGGSTALFARFPGGVRRLDLPESSWVRPVPVVWMLSRMPR